MSRETFRGAAASAESEKKEIYEEDLSLESKLESIDTVDGKVEGELNERGWPEDIAYKFSMAVHEAMANAVVHGNLGLAMEKDEDGFSAAITAAEGLEENKIKRVKVHIRISNEDATVQIKDEGTFVPDVIKDPSSQEQLLKGSGRGFLMIRDGIDNLQFSPGEIVLHKQNRDEDKI